MTREEILNILDSDDQLAIDNLKLRMDSDPELKTVLFNIRKDNQDHIHNSLKEIESELDKAIEAKPEDRLKLLRYVLDSMNLTPKEKEMPEVKNISNKID